MSTKRVLPEFKFGNRIWLIDAEEYVITDKEDPENQISGYDLRYSPYGYVFMYSISRKNVIRESEIQDITFIDREREMMDVFFIQIPHFTKMDTIGIMLKYNCSHSDAKSSTDSNIMFDRRAEIAKTIDNNKIVDDYIFQEEKAEGVSAIEISIDEFLNKKLQIFKELMKTMPALANSVGKHESKLSDVREQLDDGVKKVDSPISNMKNKRRFKNGRGEY